MGASIWVQMSILILVALGLVHYRNEQLSAVAHSEPVTARSFGRMTASLGGVGIAETMPVALRKPMAADPVPVARVAAVTVAEAGNRLRKTRGPLNGAYYRVDTQSTDVDYKNVVNRQRMLCESRHQNFWVCEETDGIVTQEGTPAEAAVFCRDCYGHSVPHLLARDLGGDTWN